MTARTSIVTAFALLAVAAPAANAKPVAHLVRGTHAAHTSHVNIPWDPRVAPAQTPRFRCTLRQAGLLIVVSQNRCGRPAVSGATHIGP